MNYTIFFLKCQGAILKIKKGALCMKNKAIVFTEKNKTELIEEEARMPGENDQAESASGPPGSFENRKSAGI